MRKFIILWLVMMGAVSVQAQQDTTPPFRVQVRFESVFVRTAPSVESEPATSIYEDEWLDVVGRNVDGTWFEVRRPNRMTNLGWVLNEMVEWDFAPELLPLTNFDTGLEGTTTLSSDPGFAITMLENTTLRDQPLPSGERITIVPIGVTVPVLARNQNGSWLRVNYIGYEGWLSVFGARELSAEVTESIPQAPNLPPLEGITVIIIPPEIQLAQVERARVFLAASRSVSDGLAGFWSQVLIGEVMPCQPPGFVNEYLAGAQDIRELPEIQRYLPQMNDGVSLLNQSIDPLYTCGPLDRVVVDRARKNAINATIMFDAVTQRLDNLEENVIR